MLYGNVMIPFKYYLLPFALFSFIGFWIIRRRRIQRKRTLYNQWIQRARNERDAKVHKILSTCDPTTARAFPLYSAVETKASILNGTLDIVQNVAFLSKRCRTFGRESDLNAITEEFYDEAAQQAENLQYKLSSLEKIPELYGVPISVKECIGLKGSYSTGGLACRLRCRDAQDSLIIQVLRSAGAIPLVSGNVTQIMMLPESFNRIWGRSLNPWDTSRTPGGSSGGDAALVAKGCVPLSVCSDVAGSIRIPASFCGVVGFKPTSTRISGKGSMVPRLHNKGGTRVVIPPVLGPIARSVDDCALFMKAVLVPEMFEGDLNLAPLPFNDSEYQSTTRKLRIGYFYSDNWFEPCPTSKRAVQEAVTALNEAGHTCVPFTLPTDGWECYRLLVAINGAEGDMRSFVEALEDEEMIPEYRAMVAAAMLPGWLSWVVRHVIDKRRAHFLAQTRSGGISVWELWQRTSELLQMRNEWSDAMKENNLDAIVHPSMPLPAFPHGLGSKLQFSCTYMALANLLLWPCGSVPVTTVRGDETYYDPPHDQRDTISQFASKVMEGSEGLPISVCVMTGAYQDEKCLRVMRDIERNVRFKASCI